MDHAELLEPWFYNQFSHLKQRVSAGSLHHGLVLSGAMGIGKLGFARMLAEGLLCQQSEKAFICGQCQGCLLNKAGSHPDLTVIDSDKQIGVDAIRQLSSKLNQTVQIGQNKVCIINKADSMTEAASNALLKTLEEPTPNTYLILVVASQHKLLPTILSRTEKHALSGPNKQQSRDWLAAQLNEPIPELLLDIMAASPYALKQLLSDDSLPDMTDLPQQIRLINQQPAHALELAKKWQNFAALLLSVCTELSAKQYQASAKNSDYLSYQNCLHYKAKEQQAGINKLLLLQSALHATATTLKE